MQRVGARLRVGHEVVVPGSIGNLGPGLDTVGVAVSLYLRVRIVDVVNDGKGGLRCRFLDGPLGGPNRIETAFKLLAPRRRRLPSIGIDVTTEIPLRSGLGSSAAATIAGLKLRELVDGRRSEEELLSVASKVEGHPDNAAPALRGGVTTCCETESGAIRVASWPWPRRWRIVVASPETELATSVSRRVLPRRVPLEDTIFNMQHLALLLGALQTGRAADLQEALQDRVHQPYRERLVPGLRRLLRLRHPDVIGFCLSGAGPSIAAITTGHTRTVEGVLHDAYRKERIACTVRSVSVHREGDA
jgi:homoserine kinase